MIGTIVVSATALLLSQQPPQPANNATESDVAALDLNALLDTPIAAVSRKEERSSQAPASVFVLTGDDILRQGFRSVDEALRSIPGLWVNDDSLYPYVGVRGLQLLGDQGTRVLVLVDGHPFNNSVGIGESNVGRDLPVDVANIDRIEVVKGPVGSVYGPSAFFGVINIKTKGADRNGGDAFLAGDFLGSLGGEAGVHYGKTVGDFSFTLGLNIQRSRGYNYKFPELEGKDRDVPPDGDVSGTDYRFVQALYATLSYKDFTLSLAHSDRTKGLPTAPYSTIVGDKTNAFYNGTNYVQLAWKKQLIEQVELYGRLSYDAFQYEDWLAYPPPPDDLGEFRDTGTDKWLGAEARATITPFSGHRDTIGAEFQSHRTDTFSRYQDVPSAVEDPVNGFGVGHIPVNFTSINVYAMVEQKLFDVLTLQGGLTYYRHSIFGNRVTPKISAVFTPTPEDTVKALYTEGFRPPTIFEAFFEDGLDFVPNDKLTAETAKSFELGYERRVFPWLSLSGSVFQNEYDNLIVSVTVPAPGLDHDPDPNEPTDFRAQFQNLGHISLWGGELGVNANYEKYLRVYGGVSIQGANFTGEGNSSANFSPVTGNFAISTRALHPSLSLALNGQFKDRRLVDPSSLSAGDPSSVDPYFLLNASARFEPTQLKGFGVQLSLYNLADTKGRDPIPSDHAPLVTLPVGPRELRLKVDYTF
ncbi:MAG: TonB-dependent receptor plug domain-containing protein [Myxococcaceae bacterium]